MKSKSTQKVQIAIEIDKYIFFNIDLSPTYYKTNIAIFIFFLKSKNFPKHKTSNNNAQFPTPERNFQNFPRPNSK